MNVITNHLSQELGLGFWNGITGLVTQPIEGAKKEGGAGFLKGIGRGIAGVVVKPGAGIYGLPGYAMKGIYKEVQLRFGKSVNNYIIAARTAQGWEMFLAIDKEEQSQIVHRYLKLLDEVKRRKTCGEDSVEAVQEFIENSKTRKREQWAKISSRTEQLSGDFIGKGRKFSDQISSKTGSLSTSFARQPSIGGKRTSEKQAPSTVPQNQTHYPDNDDDRHRDDPAFERALQESIKQTSTGDADEDKEIGQAIRASIAHLQKQAPKSGATGHGDDDEDDEELKLALAESLRSVAGQPAQQNKGALESPEIPPRSPNRSRSPNPGSGSGSSNLLSDAKAAADRTAHDYDDEDLKKAIAESMKIGDDERKAMQEEEIVLAYVKKQSLLEESYRRSHGGQGSGSG